MIYAYNQHSEGAKALAAALGVKRIKPEGSKFKGNENKIVINWGASALPEEVEKCVVINGPEAVKRASNKLTFFTNAEGKVQIPDFTTDKAVARSWSEDGKTVVARTKLNGHSGDGIYILEDLTAFDKLNHNPFKIYVKYIPKKEEYRVHVVNGKVIDIRRKAVRADFEGKPDWKVRNHQNGFIFAKDGFVAPDEVMEQSVLATAAIGLDFGAVDVIWNNFYNKAYVLEINTAPGIEGSSVDNYKAAFGAIYEAGAYSAKQLKIKHQQDHQKWLEDLVPHQEHKMNAPKLGVLEAKPYVLYEF